MTTRSHSPSYLNYSDIVNSQKHSQRGYMDQGIPDFIVLDIADLVRNLEHQWQQTIAYNAQDNSFKPDLYKIIAGVINSITLEDDAELELSMFAYSDIAAMAHYEVSWTGDLETYNRVHLELSNLTVKFGKELIARFKQEHLYHHGYLPYKFQGWMGSTVYMVFDKSHTCSNAILNKELQHATLYKPSDRLPHV